MHLHTFPKPEASIGNENRCLWAPVFTIDLDVRSAILRL